MSGLLLVISGPSGAGKTTIAREVERAFDDAVFSVSVTTRAKAPEDREGVDYHFVDEAEFDRMVEAGELLEWAGVFEARYGTPRRAVEETLARGGLMILEIDVRGGEQVKEKVEGMFGVFVLPPSPEELLQRLRSRQREDEETIQKRFREATREIEEAKGGEVYDEFVVNDDLEGAVARTVGLVRERRSRGVAGG